ncbi:MAG: D-2-hydroxyacid dehydrogenase [Thermomicrobia bacterium]|nr:D-2-hydroxyacid dehydrogenase [Thermomicrobia bacterium]
MGTKKRAKASLIVQVPLEARYVERLQQEFPDTDFPLCITPDALQAEIGNADALIGGASLTPDLLNQASKLRWVAATSAGVENLPIDALAERDILLTNFSGIAAPNIAEHVLAMMLAFARGLRPLFHQQDQHQWPESDAALPTFELGGQTLGIIGMGEIGQQLARKAHGIGMRVLAIQRRPDRKPAYVARLLTGDALPELLAESDHVCLCLPLTSATKYTIDRDELAQMQRTAYLYNIGRGGLINQEALISVLRGGTLAGAGLDVTTPEPLPADSPLWEMPNVLITGHTAASTPHYWERGMDLLVENIRRFLAGDQLRDAVDIKAGY